MRLEAAIVSLLLAYIQGAYVMVEALYDILCCRTLLRLDSKRTAVRATAGVPISDGNSGIITPTSSQASKQAQQIIPDIININAYAETRRSES
jgi:hypothetical protein